MSALLPSSFGETKVSLPPDTSTLGSGRPLPQRPVNLAFSRPPSSVISIQEGHSWSAPFKVRSQRPMNGDAAVLLAGAPAIGLTARAAGAHAKSITTAAARMNFGNFTI